MLKFSHGTNARKRVGIVRGGTGSNYDSSVRVGGDLIVYLLEHLSDKWKPLDIFIDKSGVWHLQGVPTQPAYLPHSVDVVWDTTNSNASTILENLGVPRVGVRSFSSLLETQRPLLEKHLKDIGINMPKSVLLPVYQGDIDGPREAYAIRKAQEIFEKFSSPWIVRSFGDDADMGIHVANTFEDLVHAIEDGMAHGQSILVEELIAGKLASAHAISGFRGEDVYVMPLIAVRDGEVTTDASFSLMEKAALTDLVKEMYRHLGAEHYMNSHFVVNPTRGIYLTGIGFAPDLKDAHFLYSCQAVGLKPHHVFDHMLESALH